MADILLGSYSPESLVVTMSKGNFNHRLTGFADGSFLTVTRLVPASTPYIGADLTGGRTKRKNRSATASFTLHQFSQSNKVLQDLQRADEEDDGNAWVFNLLIKDMSGQTSIFSSQTVIQTTPDASFGTDAEQRTWEFFMFNCDLQVGGNTPLDAAAQAAVTAVGGSVEDRWKA